MAAMKEVKTAIACALLLALAACSGRGGGGGAGPRLEPPAAIAAGGEVFQTGVASWYGEDFDGKATANGEIYDMHKLTAAHPSLPFDSLVEVENLGNGKKVLVRVNDRGPFLKDRVIDLSFKAAQRLDMADQGTAEVNLRVLSWGGTGNAPGPAGEPGPVATAPARAVTPPDRLGSAAPCYVQAGAFSLRQNAEDMLLTLGEIFPGLAFRIIEEDALFKVVSPRLDSAACSDMIRKLVDFRLQGFVRKAGVPEVE